MPHNLTMNLEILKITDCVSGCYVLKYFYGLTYGTDYNFFILSLLPHNLTMNRRTLVRSRKNSKNKKTIFKDGF